MPDELTDTQIALLCSIGERDPAKATGQDADDWERLRAGGYVEPGAGGKAKLTAKAVAYLGERGAGLNEG
jgi:hypothetical protein